MKHIIAYLTLALSLAFAFSPLFTEPFTGFAADQLPYPQIDPPIQPAGYAFAIWGLIYAWLIVSALFGVIARAGNDAWSAARTPLIASLAVGVPWLAIANASVIWATIAIIWMAVFAILALLRAPKQDRWLFQAPLALYAGWLTAASWVSIGSGMAGYGIVLGSFGWAITGILGALVVALLVFRLRPSAPEYFVSIIWALIGIIVANGSDVAAVSALAALGIAALSAALWLKRQG
ncbi:hypothetical protein [Planktotalea arctica]|uniref:hypothetical protein n=1 Tax=Planktotalea arctica TaxID=1481893 RepID=UPI000A17153E|nr:hypothetical protein [Planktotalea arctica]